MRNWLAFSFLLVGTFAASAQEPTEAVLPFTHVSDPQALVEAITAIRSIASIRDAKLDQQSRTLTLRTDPDSLDLWRWLMRELDQPATAQPSSTASYQVPKNDEGDVRIFRLARTGPRPSLVLRGRADQLSLGDMALRATRSKDRCAARQIGVSVIRRGLVECPTVLPSARNRCRPGSAGAPDQSQEPHLVVSLLKPSCDSGGGKR